jgi:MFS family permease
MNAKGSVKKNYRMNRELVDTDAKLPLEKASRHTGATRTELLSDCITTIGMGSYQWKLFFLCGLGWAADSMYMQAISVIQPQAQLEYDLTDFQTAALQTFMLTGMMLGAVFWGAMADIIGRRPAFMITLSVCSFFAISTAFALNYAMLCFLVVLMGFGIGGNIPIDGALFIEFVPKAQQSYLTALSIFWPVGQFIISLLSWIIMPQPSLSCTEVTNCPWQSNKGWRYTIAILGLMTVLMVIGRVLLFTLFESPRFLVSRGRFQEAVEVLHRLAEMNGKSISISAKDFISAPDDLKKGNQVPGVSNNSQKGWFKSYFHRLGRLFEKDLAKTTIFVWLIYM